MNNKNQYVLGLDIGIASVGWGIIDPDNSKIIDCGVRLFPESAPGENVKRRTNRGARRLKNRRKNRRDDLVKFLKAEGLMNDDFVFTSNPYQTRVKGLSEKLTNEELCSSLLHICKRRGNSIETVEEDEVKAQELGETKKTLAANTELLSAGKYVCEIQLMRLNSEDKKVRGTSNNFKTSDYVNELTKLLETQEISTELSAKITDIIGRRRAYYEGPGSEKSPSPYGRFIVVDGKITKIDLIEKMRGKCSIYPEELRAPKNGYSAELFNLLNDLNNLTVDDRKITEEEKQEAIQWIDINGNLTVSQLCKQILKIDASLVSGFRQNKEGKPILTEMKGFKNFRKTLGKESKIFDDKKVLDDIAAILTSVKGISDRKNRIADLNANMSELDMTKLSEMTGMTGYHSLSLKAIYEINQEMLVEPVNQMQIIAANNSRNIRKSSLVGKSKIDFDDSAILNPVVKQSQRQAIKVINQLRKVYGEFDSIVVETTREKNSAEEKKRIQENQKRFENRRKEALSLLQGKYEHVKVNGKLQEKLSLYLEQDAKCLYTHAAIDLNLLITDPTAYEVDHIIPISISLDDSFNNKALVTQSANQDKENLTPHMAITQGKLSTINYGSYESYILSLKSISRKKKEYLLFREDIRKYEVVSQFIQRNLVDTSYASRIIHNMLSDYFQVNEIETKVHTIRGGATGAFRKRLRLSKDRDYHQHHAIDALIISSIRKQPIIREMLSKYKLKAGEVVMPDTGEVIQVHDDNEYFDNQYMTFLKELIEYKVERFSYKVDRKANRQVADETIYSTRVFDGEDYVIKKYKNIYDPGFFTLAEDIIKNKVEKYLMYKHNPQTFTKLVEIVQSFIKEYGSLDMPLPGSDKKKKTNPFHLYYQEHGYVTKHAKKNDGPNIVSVKYRENKLGNHIPLKTNSSNKKVVILQISPYRTDFYITPEGQYKFITIRYSDVKYDNFSKQYYIEKDVYEEKKRHPKKKISDKDKFLFSMHRNEIIELIKEEDIQAGLLLSKSLEDLCKSNRYKWKFTATNNDETNQIEVKPIEYYEKKQLMPTIGKKIKKIFKYNTDSLGNYYKVEFEDLKLNWK